MTTISEYILSLTVLAALSGTVLVFAPDNGIKKYLRCLVSLIIALTLLMPLKNVIFALPGFLSEINSTTPGGESYEANVKTTAELLADTTAEQISSELEYSINERFGINADIIVRFDTSNATEIKLECITVGISEDCRGKADAIRMYITAQAGCKVEVIVGGE